MPEGTQSQIVRTRSFLQDTWQRFLHPTPVILLKPHIILFGILITVLRLAGLIITFLIYSIWVQLVLCRAFIFSLCIGAKELVLFVRYLPYLWLRTPDELAACSRTFYDARTDDKFLEVQTGMGTIHERYLGIADQPPHGCVYVKLYRSLDRIYQDSALMAFVRLDQDGSLDLTKLCRLWNLQNCHAIDSCRHKVYKNVTPGRLSPIAVKLLTEDQYWLRVIERPSKRVKNMRALRARCIWSFNHPVQAWQNIVVTVRGWNACDVVQQVYVLLVGLLLGSLVDHLRLVSTWQASKGSLSAICHSLFSAIA